MKSSLPLDGCVVVVAAVEGWFEVVELRMVNEDEVSMVNSGREVRYARSARRGSEGYSFSYDMPVLLISVRASKGKRKTNLEDKCP